MTDTDKRTLLALAREALEASLFGAASPLYDQLSGVTAHPYGERRGCFVTLRTEQGRLRGCIGTIIGRMPLVKAVTHLAREAAFSNPRFPPLEPSEWPAITLEITLLTEPVAITDYRAIRVGIDGVILTYEGHRSLFLPQVATEQGWGLTAMLAHLSLKAGLEPDAYTEPACRFEVFQGEAFSDETHL